MTTSLKGRSGNGNEEGNSSISVPGEAPIFGTQNVTSVTPMFGSLTSDSSQVKEIKGKFRTYNLGAELPSGNEGYASVSYMAESNGEQFALKFKSVGRKSSSLEGLLQRTTAISSALARASESNLVKDIEIIQDGRDVITVRPFIEGENLAEVVLKSPLSEVEAKKMVNDISRQLEASHKQGVVHRDVKPSNIIKDIGGTYRLIDFGIAILNKPGVDLKNTDDFLKAYDDATTNSPRGSAGYMAPETFDGVTAIPASDVFGLGQTMLYALSGQNPDHDLDFRLAREKTAKRIDELNISNDLKVELKKATSINPADRYQSAKEFGDIVIEINNYKENSQSKKELSIEEIVRQRSKKIQAVPEEITLASRELIADYKANYNGFVANRKQLDQHFVTELGNTLKGLGYEQIKGKPGFVRARKENETRDVLLFDYQKKHFVFENVDENRWNKIIAKEQNPGLQQRFAASSGRITGATAGTLALVGIFGGVYSLLGHVAFAFAASLQALGAVFKDTVIRTYRDYYGRTIEESEIRVCKLSEMPSRTIGYLVGVQVQNATQKTLNVLFENYNGANQYLSTSTGLSALKKALAPAPGFEYAKLEESVKPE